MAVATGLRTLLWRSDWRDELPSSAPAPPVLLDNTPLPPPQPPYYTTDAFTDYAVKFLTEQPDGNPFFLYVAYNCPHWPLQAKESDIKLFSGKYDEGWDKLRQKRWQQELKLGVVKKERACRRAIPGSAVGTS